MASAAVSPTIRLASGSLMPLVGFGTWKIATSDAPSVVKEALRVGYRHLDCASDYANEKEVGEGLAAAITELGIPRSEIFITSKLWNSNHRAEHVKEACELTLRDLGVDYLDLYLIHFPISVKHVAPYTRSDTPRDDKGAVLFDPVPLVETWRAMEALVDAGLVRNIGVSNFSSQLILDLLAYARIPPAVNQVERHPYLGQERLVRFCAAHNIHVTGFSPLGSPSYVPLGGVPSHVVSVTDLDSVKAIAAKHGATPAQVVLKWGISRGTSIVPKSSSLARVKENLESVHVPLTAEDLEVLDKLNVNMRFNDPINFWGVDIHA